jgi:predicted lipid-binding transport protein (Tim44 family)
LFDALIREDVNAQANQVCEVWHFVKAKSGFHMVWLLDGIQQIED